MINILPRPSIRSPRARLQAAPLLVAGALAAACGSSSSGPTFYKDVQPILTANCTGCHVAQGIAPFELTDYASAQAHGQLISAAVQAHTMPPWMPSSDTPAMVDMRVLTQAQIDTLVSWVSSGIAEGNPADAVAAPAPTAFAADATLQIPAPIPLIVPSAPTTITASSSIRT